MNFVKRLRLYQGLTQSELANLAGTSQATIAQYEAGTKSPTLSTLERMARALGYELSLSPVPELTEIDLRSLAYHEAIAEALMKKEDLIHLAQKNLARLKELHPFATDLLSRWEDWLRLPREELINKILSVDILAREMRQVSPFAGGLSARQRTDILKKLRRHRETRAV